jgi:hypothetical protein
MAVMKVFPLDSNAAMVIAVDIKEEVRKKFAITGLLLSDTINVTKRQAPQTSVVAFPSL